MLEEQIPNGRSPAPQRTQPPPPPPPVFAVPETDAGPSGNGHSSSAATAPNGHAPPARRPRLRRRKRAAASMIEAPVWEPSFPSAETLEVATPTNGSAPAEADETTVDTVPEKRRRFGRRRAARRAKTPKRPRLRLALRIFAVMVVLAALGTGGTFGTLEFQEMARTNERLQDELESSRAEAAAVSDENEDLAERASDLENEITDLNGEIERVEAMKRKVKTVVEERVVRVETPRWVPNGKGIEVDTTGFEGQIEIRDVQLTHSFGYSDFVGIAINKSGRTISYAQIGCTFLDKKGKVLANAIHNRNNWAPGASWGFDCGAEVSATGGIVRVDEMS